MVTEGNLVFRVPFLLNANLEDIKQILGDFVLRGFGLMGDLVLGDYIRWNFIRGILFSGI